MKALIHVESISGPYLAITPVCTSITILRIGLSGLRSRPYRPHNRECHGLPAPLEFTRKLYLSEPLTMCQCIHRMAPPPPPPLPCLVTPKTENQQPGACSCYI